MRNGTTLSVRIRRAGAVVAAALMCITLAACSASSESGGDATATRLSEPGVILDALPADGSAEFMSVSEEAAADSGAEGRSIISTGSVTLRVEDPQASVGEVTELAKRLGGYVESQNVTGTGADARTAASLSLRVPSDKFDAAFTELSALGDVAAEDRAQSDVTATHVDLQARVASLQTSVDRLTELMAGAATTSELIEAESALTARQADLDGLRAQLEALEGQVNEATIWVSLTREGAIAGGPSNFWEGLLAGLDSLTLAGAGGLVVLGVLLPWLVIAGVATLIIVLIVRARKRKKVTHEEPRNNQTSETPAAPELAQAAAEPSPGADSAP